MRRADSLEKKKKQNTLCWERLRAGGEGGNRGWDCWIASSTQCARDWANSGRRWRTGKPDVLQPLGSQTVRHNQVTEKQQQQQYFIFVFNFLLVWPFVFLCDPPWVNPVWSSLCFSDLVIYFLSHVSKFSTIMSSNIFLGPLSLSSFRDPYNVNIGPFYVVF